MTHTEFFPFPAKRLVLDALVVVLGTVLILGPALINGFPFVYPDTGTYLASAFRGMIPVDRPCWYGAFMRIASLGGHSFWGIITGQALLCSLYIFRAVRFFVPGRTRPVALGIIALLSAFSSLGWYAGQLMADIFTGIGLLATWLLVMDRGRPWMKALDAVVAIFCTWVHLSNLLILPLCAAWLLLVYPRPAGARSVRHWSTLVAITILAWAGLMTANRIVDREFYLSRGGHAFMVARMVDTGMLKAWLDEHCPDEDYRLCAYRDRLPWGSGPFLWTDSISPMHLEGGWLATKPEYDRIIRSTFLEPEYLWWHIRSSASSTCDLLTRWTICSGLENTYYRTPESPPYFMIEGTIRSGLEPYLSSMQNGGRGELRMAGPDRWYVWFLALCAVIAVCVPLVFRKDADAATRRTLILFGAGCLVLACWVCATLAVVDDRYLGRVSWIFALMTLIALASAWSSRRAGQFTIT